MSRWLEEMGATNAATIVEAARREALASAFCISIDATGVAIQPERTSEKKRPKHLAAELGSPDIPAPSARPSEQQPAAD